jgi:hypothetical protein
MLSENTNMFYIQTTIFVKVSVVQGSVLIVRLKLLSRFSRSHSDTPYSVGHLRFRDRRVAEIST